jgi:predicted glycosyltransferase
MKLLFYFGHPAQYLFLRETIRRLIQTEKHEIVILIKTKDVLESLVKADGIPYRNILMQERGHSKLAVACSLVQRLITIFPILIRQRPDLLIGTDATLAQLGMLLGIDRITIIEDDYEIIKTLAKLTFPFTQTILCPVVCGVGKWTSKKVGYTGYMKLGYLHPNVFKVDEGIRDRYGLNDSFVLVRLVRLTAHHDFGVKGINGRLLDQLISVVEGMGHKVVISSESPLDEKYIQYRLEIQPTDMHQILAVASLLVCDSQSMSVEAAVLGTPSIRYSSFAGRISVLEELEHTYQLTYGIQPGQEEKLLAKAGALLAEPHLKEDFQQKRMRMLQEKIDVTAFLFWFIENYPASAVLMKTTKIDEKTSEHYWSAAPNH